MARRVFFSFDYAKDAWRTSTVRSIGAIEGNRPAAPNAWETVRKGFTGDGTSEAVVGSASGSLVYTRTGLPVL